MAFPKALILDWTSGVVLLEAQFNDLNIDLAANGELLAIPAIKAIPFIGPAGLKAENINGITALLPVLIADNIGVPFPFIPVFLEIAAGVNEISLVGYKAAAFPANSLTGFRGVSFGCQTQFAFQFK